MFHHSNFIKNQCLVYRRTVQSWMTILHQLSRAFNRKQRHLALISIAQGKLIFFLFVNSNAENYIFLYIVMEL